MKPAIQSIVDILDSIEGNTSFLSTGTEKIILPDITIDGVSLALPIVKENIEQIIKKSTLAPFGKGLETVVDTKVRHTYEVDSSQVNIGNSLWYKTLNNILDKVIDDLGLADVDVSANLYKLLIYKEGSFFKKHKDAEKEPGMFGTLIVNLPSKFRGGELVINFGDEQKTVQFSEYPYDFSFAAFYTDCDHEVKVLKDGYKVGLVYNLVQSEAHLNLSSSGEEALIARMTEELKYLSKSNIEKPLLFLFDHQYTQENYSRAALKSSDMLKANILEPAAKQADYFLNFGLLCHTVSGEVGHDGYETFRYGGDISDDPDSYTIEYIIDDYAVVSNWINVDQPNLGSLNLEEFQIINEKAYKDESEAIEKSVDGYLGNAGVTVEYLYQFGVAALIPNSKLHLMLKALSNEALLSWIGKQTQAKTSIGLSIEALIDTFAKKNNEGFVFIQNVDALISVFCSESKSIHRKYLLKIIGYNMVSVRNAKNCATFLSNLEENELHLVNKYIPHTKSLELAHKMSRILFEMVKISNIAEEKLKNIESSLLIQFNNWSKKTDYYYSKNKYKADLLNQLYRIDSKYSLSGRFLDQIRLNVNRKELYNYLLPSLNKSTSSHFRSQIIDLCLKYLKNATKSEILPYPDFQRPFEYEGALDKSLIILKEFLEDPTAQRFVYARKQSERDELQDYINRLRLDIDTKTVKQGSPHQLILTKNENSYRQKSKYYTEDIRMIVELERMGERG